jgi:hypothetical protein
MLRHRYEVLTRAQKHDIVPDAELRDERIDYANLHTGPAACVFQDCCGNMVFTVRLDRLRDWSPCVPMCVSPCVWFYTAMPIPAVERTQRTSARLTAE